MRFIGSPYERDVRKSLLSYLPTYYHNSKTVNEMIRVDAEELERLYASIYDVLNQFFVRTATWGLDIWERELGIVTVPEDSYEVRRARIESKLRGGKTFNKWQALELAKSFSEIGEKTWFKDNFDGTFITGFDIDDLIDLNQMLLAFDDVKPAHLFHITALLICLDYSPDIDIKSILKQRIKSVFYSYIFEKINILFKNKMFLSTKYRVEDEFALTLNGAWALDGSQELDGINDEGYNLYFRASENLYISVYKNGELIENEKV